MVLITRCPACGYTLRFADDQAGQTVRCFSCEAACTVPPAEGPESGASLPDVETATPDYSVKSQPLASPDAVLDTNPGQDTPAAESELTDLLDDAVPDTSPARDASAAASDLAIPSTETPLLDSWWAQTATGDEYGPVTKSELENWARDGRIDHTFRLRQGQGMWHPAADTFPDLPDALENDTRFAPVSAADNSPFAPATIADDSPFQSTDSSNPFQPPRQEELIAPAAITDFADEQSVERLRERVRWPALFLIIFACLMMLFQVVVNGFNLAVGNFNLGVNPFAIQTGVTAVATIIGLVISLGSSIVTLFGAIKMRQLQSYGFAVTACVLPMIPCINSCCCVLALPFSTWGLVVLLDPNVRSLFNQPVAIVKPVS